MHQAAGVFWAISHFFGFIWIMQAWKKHKYSFYLYSAASWFTMSLWGLTLFDNRWIHFINGVIIPPLASVFGLIAIYLVQRQVKVTAKKV